MQLKPILFDSYTFYLRNFRQIASLCLPFLLLDASSKLLFNRSQDFQSLYWVSHVAIYPVYTAALILLMAKRANQEHSDNLDLITASLKLWWPFYLLTVIQLALGLVGFLLFIIPGLLVLVRLAFAEFYLVLNGLTPWEAIRQSIDSTKRYFWYLMGFFAIIIFCDGISDYLIGRAFLNADNLSLAFIAVSAIVSLLMLFFDVVLFRTFMTAVADESPAQDGV